MNRRQVCRFCGRRTEARRLAGTDDLVTVDATDYWVQPGWPPAGRLFRLERGELVPSEEDLEARAQTSRGPYRVAHSDRCAVRARPPRRRR